MLGIALVPEKRELFGTMPVEDNLVLGAFRQVRLRNKKWRDQTGRGVPAFSAPQGAAQRSWRAPCRVASARCWRSAAH
jgi:ABC-type branched-subunit amino acid transport system ATPase component